jgi:hypothetical protein
MSILTPERLALDAVVPQCLDNQFISNDVCTYMSRNRVNYNDPVVMKMRKEDIQTEFIRSLIYSSQVVINRYYLKNNHLLYINYLPDNPAIQRAFIRLLNEKRIIPYLYREKTLDEKLDLKVNVKSDEALNRLLMAAGDITCVRFSDPEKDTNDEHNIQKTDDLSIKFENYLRGLTGIVDYDSHYNPMWSEISVSMSRNLIGTFGPEDKDNFRQYLSNFCNKCIDERIKNRDTVYRRYFIDRTGIDEHLSTEDKERIINNKVVNGDFKDFRQDKYLFMLKKLIDLRYNSNLPDILHRYTFTPLDMPTRLALQDPSDNNDQDAAGGIIEASVDQFHYINQVFLANMQRGLTLPLFKELTVADVIEIQQFDEWQEFINEQISLLDQPANMLNHFEPYRNKLIALQKKISDWYTKNRVDHNNIENSNVWPYITILIDFGVIALNLGLRKMGLNDQLADIAAITGHEAMKATVKLAVNMVNLHTGRINKDLSYSLQVVHSDYRVTADQLRALVTRVYEIGGDFVIQDGLIPDQAK